MKIKMPTNGQPITEMDRRNGRVASEARLLTSSTLTLQQSTKAITEWVNIWLITDPNVQLVCSRPTHRVRCLLSKNNKKVFLVVPIAR